MERLFKGLRGPLRLGLVALEALVGIATTALSGLGLAFLLRFGPGHGVCLHKVGAILRVWRYTMALYSCDFNYFHDHSSANPYRW